MLWDTVTITFPALVAYYCNRVLYGGGETFPSYRILLLITHQYWFGIEFKVLTAVKCKCEISAAFATVLYSPRLAKAKTGAATLLAQR